MNPDELKNLVPLVVAALGPIAAKYGIDAGLLTQFLIAAIGIGGGVYLHWNQKKVPETATAISTATPMPVGSTVPPSVAAAAKVVGALLIGFLVLHGAPAAAQARKEAAAPLCDPLNLLPGCKQSNGAIFNGSAQTVANALAQPFEDIANFIANDNTQAIALATAIPSLQDGNGQQCWIAMQTFGQIVKAHPIPVTLKVASDIEALRLAEIAANKVCGNSACTQVFADLTNTVQAASPTPLPIPSLNSLCSKVPQIAVVPPVAVTATSTGAAPTTAAPTTGTPAQ